MNSDLPFVLVNMAMTADGKIATANREVSSFGSARDRRHLLELRASADAVMSGARTVDLNPVSLGPGPAKYRQLRLKNGLAEFNLRVVASGLASVNPDAAIFRRRFSRVIVLSTKRAPRAGLQRLRAAGADVAVFGRDEIDFRQALRWLRSDHGVRRLLCEGGGAVNDGLLRAGMVDELHLTICPLIFGGRAAPTIADGRGFSQLRDTPGFRLTSSRRAGMELFLVYSKAMRV